MALNMAEMIIALHDKIEKNSLVGEIKMFAGATVPEGWLLCDGSTFSKLSYPKLAEVLGDAWDTHSGDTYYLPNLCGKVPVGSGDSDIGADVGATGGAKGAWRHSHTALSNGIHIHSDRVGWFDAVGTNNTIQAGGTAATTGSKSGHLRIDDGYGVIADGAHTHSTDAKGSTNNAGTTTSAINIANMPPYAVVKYIICAY